jgi:integrating conjugative element protein (TIGR03757 family)
MLRVFLVALPLGLFLGLSTAAWGEAILFRDVRHEVSVPPGVRVVDLDAPARLEAALSAKLPTDPARAEAIARTRLIDDGMAKRLLAAYRGVQEARALGVSKLPAVVVDRRYVVYGEADVTHALARIAAIRRKTP